MFHGKNKHIEIRFHFLRNLVNDEVIELSFCNSQDQIAVLIKLEQFEKLREMLGLIEATIIS